MPTRLTSADLEVMQILWARGESKPAEILADFPREIKNPALRSILAILIEKGHVVRRKEGKAYFYKARTRRQSVFRSMVREVTDVFCQGSTEALLMNLISSQKLSEKELLALKKLADQSNSKKDSKKGSKS